MTRSDNVAGGSGFLGEVAQRSLSRRSLLRWGALAGAGAVLAPAVTACVAPSAPGGGATGSTTLTLGLNRSLVSLDNKLNQFDAAVTVQRAVRQALTEIGDDLKPRNVLAESFELTSPTQWTVKLRNDIKYSDGSSVAVEDVAKALEMYSQVNGSFLAPQFPEWPTVTKKDELTFTLDTKAPLPVLSTLMSNILITPAAANKPEELQDGVGTGPYKVASADRGTGTYKLVVNENYWGEKPSVSEVNVRFMSEESSRVVALRSGEVDVIDSITPDSVAQLKSVDGIEIESVTGTRYNQLFYNFRKPADSPMSDPKVREALSYGFDSKSVVEGILGGTVTSAKGVVPQTLAGAVETGEYAYDPGKAKSLLAGLGVSNLSVKVIWETGEFAADVSIMEALVEMMKEIGVTAELQQFEPGGDISSWRQGKAGDWDILGNGYGNQTGLALTNLQGMYAGTAEKEATRDTYHGFVFPEISSKIITATSETDQAKSTALLTQVQKDIWAKWPCMWAFIPNAVLARRARVEGVKLRPINSYQLSTVKVNG
ncbi:ABC transporter substrate-binding protein [Pseudarthrobacter sp. MEB009]|uniref:ABC transporter substrate-binding protein n=1 Tax=Pseudarthrobacter sp. MEB009 TaxID=3040326 RepID=UPI00255248A5|nr:ABC transporter substrate-binding protein [Pseudarthrobacter sp. MEB009]